MPTLRFGLSQLTGRLSYAVAGGLVAFFALPGATIAAVNLTASPGHIIYNSGGGTYAYYYGPSIFMDSAGMHVYACSPGSGSVWDYVRYMLSSDGGNTFGPQSIVLQPTSGSADALSTCDPSVVEFGGYYYIGYTSTANPVGTQNQVFVARSTSPTGPFDKWNGSGWGGNPSPLIAYTGNSARYGAGEPSLVVVGSTLYIYYSWYDEASDGTPTEETRVATASTSDPNWPANLTYLGTAIPKEPYRGQDSSDVKYVDAYGKFIALNTASRFGPKAYLQLWESTDGVIFTPSNVDEDNFISYLHNDGLSGDSSGHVDVTSSQYAGYAYGPVWGSWNTFLNPVSYSNDSHPGRVDIYSYEPRNGAIRLEFQTSSAATSYTVSYGTQSGNYTGTVTGITGSPFTLSGLNNGTRYYVTIKAVNDVGSGTSSAEVSAVPQNYQLIAASSASASSSISGWPASYVIDGNMTTTYSSDEHTSAAATEWVTVDYGADYSIGKLVVVSRQRNLWAAPMFDNSLDTQVQVSSDGQTWFGADYRLNLFTIVDDDGYQKTVITFPQPLYGRYIRLYSSKLNPDQYNNYYLQIGEIQAYSVPLAATASSSISGLEPWWVLDTDVNTIYSSAPGDASPWIQVDLGSVQQVSGVNVTPRSGGTCFPISFVLQSSQDGSTWSTIPGQSYTNYPNPGSNVQAFTFASAIAARYIRLEATQLAADQYGNHYLQIAGIALRQSLPFSASASTQLSGLPASAVSDGVSATVWSSAEHSTPSATEWLQLDMGASHTVKDLRLVPRDQNCFPSAFTITYSSDGQNWTQIPGQAYSYYTSPTAFGTTPNPVQLFWFSTPVTARYFKITATTLTADTYGNYYFQLADAYIDQ